MVRPQNRCIDAVEEDAKKILGVMNWKRKTMDRETWRVLIHEAKARYRTVAPYKKKKIQFAAGICKHVPSCMMF